MKKKEKQVRGRPSRSVIRENMSLLLTQQSPQYGYELFKQYLKRFPPVSLRSIYYHLHKGVENQEFAVIQSEKAIGDFSWGRTSERTLYSVRNQQKQENKSRKKKKQKV